MSFLDDIIVFKTRFAKCDWGFGNTPLYEFEGRFETFSFFLPRVQCLDHILLQKEFE